MKPDAEWDLPQLREAHKFEKPTDVPKSVAEDFWSVNFYPFNKPGVDSIFAIVSGRTILICRPPQREGSKTEVIQSIADLDEDAENYCSAWTKNLETGEPLLCVAGANTKIKVINALTGKLERTFVGHGGEIDDLAISPINCQILASCSEDSTVRIWSLDPAHEKHPCAAILAGESHKDTISTIAFHASGRYLLSGGFDHVINLWTLPEFPDSNTGTDKTTQIFYPNFSTTEIHSQAVDCIAFHGDLILSRAAQENTIVLWSITGFSSSNPIPSISQAPTTADAQKTTYSAFYPPNSPFTLPAHIRLLQFCAPESSTLTMRFSLFPGISPSSSSSSEETPSEEQQVHQRNNTHPILAICNTTSKVYFWDLMRLEVYTDYITSLSTSSTSSLETGANANSFSSNESDLSPPIPKPSFLNYYQHRNRGGSLIASSSSRGGGGAGTSSSKTLLHARTGRAQSPTSSVTTTSSTSRLPPPPFPPSLTKTPSSLSQKDKIPEQANLPKSLKAWRDKYYVGERLNELLPHREETVKGLQFMGRQAAWSVGGDWCVAVGSAGCVAVLGRWNGEWDIWKGGGGMGGMGR